MKNPSARHSPAYAMLGIALCLSAKTFGADTHTVVAHPNLTWTYNGKASSAAQPIMVDDLKAGDVVEIQVPGGQHGFITIKKVAGSPTIEVKDPVLACGEAPNSKPNAALREIECGANSKFGVPYTGSLKLEVLPSFKAPVDFYCWIHKAAMPGTLKLKAS
jgi:hypothetical protein